MSSLQKFYVRYHEMVDRYGTSVSKMKTYFSLWQLSFFLFHRILLQYRNLDDQHGRCLIRNRRCLLYRCTWPRPRFLFGSGLFRHVYFCSCVVLVCCLCLYLCYLCFQCCDCLRTILKMWLVVRFLTYLFIEEGKKTKTKTETDKQKATNYEKKTMGRYSWEVWPI